MVVVWCDESVCPAEIIALLGAMKVRAPRSLGTDCKRFTDVFLVVFVKDFFVISSLSFAIEDPSRITNKVPCVFPPGVPHKGVLRPNGVGQEGRYLKSLSQTTPS